MNENKILIHDIETTGFLNKGGKIVEVGIVELNVKTGIKQILFDKVVNPGVTYEEASKSWICNNSSLIAEQIVNAPSLKSQIPIIQGIIDSYPLGSTAYNHAFDFGFYKSVGIKVNRELACPMKVSTPILKLPGRFGDYKWPSVQEAWDFFFGKTGYIEEHRGADDAFHEADIVMELIRRGKFPIKPLDNSN